MNFAHCILNHLHWVLFSDSLIYIQIYIQRCNDFSMLQKSDGVEWDGLIIHKILTVSID